MNELFTCNNPGLLRFVKRQNAAEQGAANYLYKLVHAAGVREKKRANRCHLPGPLKFSKRNFPILS